MNYNETLEALAAISLKAPLKVICPQKIEEIVLLIEVRQMDVVLEEIIQFKPELSISQKLMLNDKKINFIDFFVRSEDSYSRF